MKDGDFGSTEIQTFSQDAECRTLSLVPLNSPRPIPLLTLTVGKSGTGQQRGTLIQSGDDKAVGRGHELCVLSDQLPLGQAVILRRQ
jgi:hypothetical protein